MKSGAERVRAHRVRKALMERHGLTPEDIDELEDATALLKEMDEAARAAAKAEGDRLWTPAEIVAEHRARGGNMGPVRLVPCGTDVKCGRGEAAPEGE